MRYAPGIAVRLRGELVDRAGCQPFEQRFSCRFLLAQLAGNAWAGRADGSAGY